MAARGIAGAWLVASAALLALPWLATGLPTSTGGSADRGPDGTAALAGVLRRRGHEVESLGHGLRALRQAPPAGVVLLPPDPSALRAAPFTQADALALQDYAEGGGLVVAVVEPEDRLAELLGATVRRDPAVARGGEAAPVLPDPCCMGALTVAGAGWIEPVVGDSLLYAAGTRPVAVRRPVGRGSFVLLADRLPMTNAGIDRASNLEFLVGLVESHGGPAFVDDFHAGAGAPRGLIAWARGRGLGGAVAALGIVTALGLWRALVAEAAPLPEPRRLPVRPASDSVRAIAELYRRAGLHGWMLAAVARGFRRRMERRTRRRWSDEAFAAALEGQAGAETWARFAALRSQIGALLRQGDPSPEDVAAAIEAMDRFEAALPPRR